MNDDDLDQDPEESALIFERSTPGWWRVSGDFPQIYVGSRVNDRGRVVITCVLVAPKGREVGTADLRRIPLGRVATHLNLSRGREWAELAPQEIDVLRQLEDAADEGPGQFREPSVRRERIRRPPRQDSDAFYREVATAYRSYAARGNKPAVEIASEAAVPVATARRWINLARRRGHLGPGQRGRVTG